MRLRTRLMSVVVLAATTGLSALSGQAQASPSSSLFLLSPSHNPVNAAKHLSALPTVKQSIFASSWATEFVGMDPSGVPQYHISFTGTGVKKCMDTASGGVSAGTAVTAVACTAFSQSSTQNWRLVGTGVSGKVKMLNTRSGLVAGIRGASTAEGAVLELQNDVSAPHQIMWQTSVE
ncbi:RICIN domain-containing protein [Streptomyces sp. NPDC099088]|uniref:RICIN domain-containing protein n=1 Tax=Streptomyces sp. NPDC099088 TaxID=3366101 RepID=UPI00382EBA73